MPKRANGTIQMDLWCKLDEQEVVERSVVLSRLLKAQAKHAEEKVEFVAKWKSRMEELTNEVGSTATAIAQGAELRPVDCNIDFDLEQGTATVVRSDTGEVVEARPMTPREKQLRLDDAP